MFLLVTCGSLLGALLAAIIVPLNAGRYEYAFVVDGKRWIADPAASHVRDEFGGETSVLRLAGGDRAM